MKENKEMHPRSAGTAIIDWSVLASFSALGKPGRPDPGHRLLTVFLDASPPLMEAIMSAAANEDYSALRGAAHSLKSSARNMGATGLGDLCEELERTMSGNEAAYLLERVEKEYAAVEAAFRETLNRKGE